MTADGRHKYSVFVAKSGKRAVVVANQEAEKEVSPTDLIPNPGRLAMASPEDRVTKPVRNPIPKCSAVVVMEI